MLPTPDWFCPWFFRGSFASYWANDCVVNAYYITIGTLSNQDLNYVDKVFCLPEVEGGRKPHMEEWKEEKSCFLGFHYMTLILLIHGNTHVTCQLLLQLLSLPCLDNQMKINHSIQQEKRTPSYCWPLALAPSGFCWRQQSGNPKVYCIKYTTAYFRDKIPGLWKPLAELPLNQ